VPILRRSPHPEAPRETIACVPARPLLALLALLAPLAGLIPDAAAWTRPVPGPVVRGFEYGSDPFAPGQRRGVVLSAGPRARVACACAGAVVFAGRVAGGRAVSVRCGGWHVAYGRLETRLRAGARVREGATLGRVAGGRGLHLSVRRAADPFGYVDPLRLLPPARLPPPPPVLGPRTRPPLRPRVPAAPLPPVPLPLRAPTPALAPSAVRALAPWPVWLGLALLLAGAGARGAAHARRRRRWARAWRAAEAGR